MEQLQFPVELACEVGKTERIESTLASATAVGQLSTVSGALALNNFEAVSATEVASGDDEKTVTLITKATIVAVEKADTVTFIAGAPVYWDATAKKGTSVSTDNTLIGYADRAIGANDTSIFCSFDGRLALKIN